MTQPKLPPDLQPFVDAAIAMARKRLEEGHELHGVAFIHAPADQDVGVVVIPMDVAPSKDVWARMVHTISAFAEARFVLVVSEIWVHETPNTPGARSEIDALMEKHGEVRLIPGRRDAVLVQIETHDGLWQGHADVTTVAVASKPGCRTFGAIELHMMTHNEGRLVGLLGSRRRGKPT